MNQSYEMRSSANNRKQKDHITKVTRQLHHSKNNTLM